MGGGATALAHGGGRRFGGSVPSGWAVGSGNAGEIPAGFGPEAVTPAGATIPSWRVSVVFTPTSLCVPGETLGLVRVAASSASHSFLEVLLGTRRFGTSVCGGLYPVGAAVAGHPRFAELPWLAFVSSSFSFGVLCCSPQRSLYSVLVALEYKAGGNPFSVIWPRVLCLHDAPKELYIVYLPQGNFLIYYVYFCIQCFLKLFDFLHIMH